MNQKLEELTFVGVDTRKDEHTACISDYFGQPLGVFTVENRPDDIDELLKQIDRTAKSHDLRPVFGREDVMSRSTLCQVTHLGWLRAQRSKSH